MKIKRNKQKIYKYTSLTHKYLKKLKKRKFIRSYDVPNTGTQQLLKF